jgi:hypothetical protein
MINFDAKFNEYILKGIITGYKDYIEVRNYANETMVISDAYAYVKANHIDDQVAKHLLEFVEIIKQSAGPSWKYLKFSLNDELTENGFKFILKNERYFDANNVTKGKKLIENNDSKNVEYLEELIKDNEDVDFENIKNYYKIDHQISGDSLLFTEPYEEDKNRRKPKFLIITYGIDYSSKILNTVKIWAPNPLNKKAILLKDLTQELNKLVKHEEDYSLDDEQLKVLQNDGQEIYTDPFYSFGISANEGVDKDQSDN